VWSLTGAPTSLIALTAGQVAALKVPDAVVEQAPALFT
jgi:hypothetical protein